MNEYIEEYGDSLADIISRLSMALEGARLAETAMRQLKLRSAHNELVFVKNLTDQAYTTIRSLTMTVERATRN